MFRVVGLQVLATALVAALAWAIAGRHAAWSACVGGAACFVPNGLFAAKLTLASIRPGGTSVAVLLIGEFVKLGLMIGILVLIATTGKNIVWPALIIAVIAALKLQVLAWASH